VGLDYVGARYSRLHDAGTKTTHENHHDLPDCHLYLRHEEHRRRVATTGVEAAAHIRTEDAAAGSLMEEDLVEGEAVEGSCTVGSQTCLCYRIEDWTRRKENPVCKQNESRNAGIEKCSLSMSNERQLIS